METIAESKQYIHEHIKEGVLCPSCTQRVQMYKDTLNSNLGYALILLHKHSSRGEFVRPQDLYQKHAPDSSLSHGGHFAKTKYWGLIESAREIKEDGNSSGLWRITDKGRDFVEGKINVPKCAWSFNNKFQGFEGEPISINQSLGKKFNYVELVGHTYKGIGEQMEMNEGMKQYTMFK